MPRWSTFGRVMLLAAAVAAVVFPTSGCATSRRAQPGARTQNLKTKGPDVRTLKLPYRNYGKALMVGRALYATVDPGTGQVDTLLRHDVDSGESRTLITAPADIGGFTVNERWLVWESEKRLLAEPVGGGNRQVLATNREMYAPALEGDLVAWVDHSVDDVGGKVVTFNLKTGEKREVARTRLANFYNNFMQIRDGKLLWTDIYDGNGHYVVHDLATAKTTDYPMPATRFRYPGYAVRSGDAVYSINFDRYDEWNWCSQQVGRYSLSDRKFTPITKDGDVVNMLAMGRDAVALIDSNQRMLIGPADGTAPARDMTAALGAWIDTVWVSPDGVTTVAGRSSWESTETTFYIFELR